MTPPMMKINTSRRQTMMPSPMTYDRNYHRDAALQQSVYWRNHYEDRIAELEAENARLNMEMVAYREKLTPKDVEAMTAVIKALTEEKAARATAETPAEPAKPRGKCCTCDNCLGSSTSCRVDAGERLGDLWYCEKRYRESQAKTGADDVQGK
jgi:hypothetical protein